MRKEKKRNSVQRGSSSSSIKDIHSITQHIRISIDTIIAQHVALYFHIYIFIFIFYCV
jgi:hypothetical protein